MGKRSFSVRETKIKHACNFSKATSSPFLVEFIANLERTQRTHRQMQYQNIMEAIINTVPTKA